MAVSRNVLVTGGAGFIGIHVIEELQRRGHTAFVFDNLSFARRSLVPVPESQFMQGDIRDAAAVTAAFSKFAPDVVIHLAAIHFIPYCNAHPYEAADVNIRGTMNVLDAAAARPGLTHVLFASTAAVYPVSDDPLTETSPTGPLDIYGLTKLTGERLCHEFFLHGATPTTVVRFFNAFGTKETNPHLIPEIHKQVLGGARRLALGNLAPKRDFIHTTDMAKALTGLVEAGGRGYDTFNLGSGSEYSVTDVVEAFSRAIGEELVIDVDPARVRKVERMHLLADASKLAGFLGWKPLVSLDEGIAELARETRAYDQYDA
jgi:UDP-glucose 4-epimerase